MPQQPNVVSHQTPDSCNSTLPQQHDGNSIANELSGHGLFEVTKTEATLYYFGLRGRKRCPRLIFRTSKDKFPVPEGPHPYTRPMKLLPVYEHDKLGKSDLWTIIRAEIVKSLDKRNIRHSSVDLVRFSWEEIGTDDADCKHEDEKPANEHGKHDHVDKDDAEGNNQAQQDEDHFDNTDPRKVVTAPITIWVGVLPGTLSAEVAHRSSQEILDLLRQHDIFDFEVAYRESVVRPFGGPELFAPVSYFDPLKPIIHPLTTALGLPIAGLASLERQGTLGIYFRRAGKLYAVTARHVLFPEEEGNFSYEYIEGSTKREVVLMGNNAFADFIKSVQDRIRYLDVEIGMFTAKQEVRFLEETQRKLSEAQSAIGETKKLLAKVWNEWDEPENRIIGHVVWAPPIMASDSIDGYGYTEDICVVELNDEKFGKNLKGNVLDLGSEIDPGRFVYLLHLGTGSDFEYPLDHGLKLSGILSPQEMRKPANRSDKNELMRYVIKRSHSTPTTIGCLTGFESHVRQYSLLGTRDSVEATFLRYPYADEWERDLIKAREPFARQGDSGTVIVDPLGNLIALLTLGTGSTDADVTYGSPMHWLWEVIKTQFPGAELEVGQ